MPCTQCLCEMGLSQLNRVLLLFFICCTAYNPLCSFFCLLFFPSYYESPDFPFLTLSFFFCLIIFLFLILFGFCLFRCGFFFPPPTLFYLLDSPISSFFSKPFFPFYFSPICVTVFIQSCVN